MKIILYTWGSYLDNGLKQSLIELGHDVVIYDHKCMHYTKDIKMAQGLIDLIHKSDAQAVISYDYFPIISLVCNTTGIVYYSWVYDSPHYTLFAKAAAYECNRIGCFDMALVKRLNNLGNSCIHFNPLGVCWPKQISENTSYKYNCDLSFVGSLYTDKYDYLSNIKAEDSFLKRIYECVNKQCFDYKRDHISGFFTSNNGEKDILTINRVRDVLAVQKLLLGEEYFEDVEYIFASSFLEKQTTIEERRRLLQRIAETKYDVKLYTGSDLTGLPELERINVGYIDYYKTMPKVFRKSRINLNITLRSIKTGIPLRALDIMGCGGFLLSNYQKDLASYFMENREVVLFYSLEDCLEKITYYLEHEEERRKIALAGYKAVREKFDRKTRLLELLKN